MGRPVRSEDCLPLFSRFTHRLLRLGRHRGCILLRQTADVPRCSLQRCKREDSSFVDDEKMSMPILWIKNVSILSYMQDFPDKKLGHRLHRFVCSTWNLWQSYILVITRVFHENISTNRWKKIFVSHKHIKHLKDVACKSAVIQQVCVNKSIRTF